MSRTRRWPGPALTVLPMLAALAVLPGCAWSDPASWSDQVCAAVTPWADSVRNAATVDPTNLAAAQQIQAAALRAGLDGLNRTDAGLDRVGASPIDGGDDLVGQLKAAVGQLKATVTAGTSEIDAANPHDPIPFSTALERSGRGLTGMETGLDEARRGFAGNAALATAAASAPNCQRIGFGPADGPASTSPVGQQPG